MAQVIERKRNIGQDASACLSPACKRPARAVRVAVAGSLRTSKLYETVPGMKVIAAVSLLGALQGCTSSPPSAEAELMDKIERQVKLPAGAEPLARYARYYALDRQGQVLGVYLIPFSYDIGPDDGCSEVTANFELKDTSCPPEASQVHNLKAGQRRWLARDKGLPVVNDGGCSVVNVVFDRQKGTVEDVFCNGVA